MASVDNSLKASGYGAAQVKPKKVLLAGDVRGEFGTLYSKVITAHEKHGPFDCVFCVGDFLSSGDDPASSLRPYISGEKKAPITTYLLNARPDCAIVRELLAGCPSGEIAKEIVLLAGSALTVFSGLKVAYDARPAAPPDAPAGPARPGDEEHGFAETEELDAAFARKGFTGVDLLLTCEWPLGVCDGLDPPAREQAAAAVALGADGGEARGLETFGTRRAARIAATARPRYHFAGCTSVAYARPPYANAANPSSGGEGGLAAANGQAAPAPSHVTRFVSLAPVGDKRGRKWLHALNLVPMARMASEKLSDIPEGTTRNPFAPCAAAASAAEGVAAGGGGANGGAGAQEPPRVPQPYALPPPPPLPITAGIGSNGGLLPLPPPHPAPPPHALPFPPQYPGVGQPPMPPLPPGPPPLHVAFGLPPPPPAPPPGAKRARAGGDDGGVGGGRKRAGGRARGGVGEGAEPYSRAADDTAPVDVAAVCALLAEREAARAERDFARADSLRAALRDSHAVLVDDNGRTWRVAPAEGRSAAAAARPWAGKACWFCMASEHFEAHLVVAVGAEAYVAAAKGPLVPASSIVLPVPHCAGAHECPPAALAEMLRFRAALGECCASAGVQTVAFERQMGARPGAHDGGRDHLHLQVVPLPPGLDAAAVRRGLEEEGERAGIGFEWSADASWPPPGVSAGEGYLWYQLPHGHGALLHRISPTKRHPMIFARQALARAFGMAQRADWKACMPDPCAPGCEGKSVAALEAEEVDALKRRFAPFDPTQGDDDAA